MFGQVFDKLDAYFGRAFLLSRLVPWLLCAVANILLACLEFPAWRGHVSSLFSGIDTDRAVTLLMALLGVSVVAYVTSPLVQFTTAFLEAPRMPQWLSSIVGVTHALRCDALDAKARLRLVRSRDADGLPEVLAGLQADRLIGCRIGKLSQPKAIDLAAAGIGKLLDARRILKPIGLTQIEAAKEKLSKALRSNCADRTRFADASDQATAARLQGLLDTMRDTLVPYAKADAKQRDSRTVAERYQRFARELRAPTQLGNDAAALRSYCETRYGIDFDFFWPRFLLVAQKDAKLGEALASAKIQLDFSILALSLSTITVGTWTVFLAFAGTSLGTALAVVGLGPLVVYIWLAIVHVAYSGFADMVQSAVDLNRFQVLAMLRHPLPISTDDEARCWAAAQALTLFDQHRPNVAFRHPATP